MGFRLALLNIDGGDELEVEYEHILRVLSSSLLMGAGRRRKDEVR